MAEGSRYSINLDEAFGFLRLVDAEKLAAGVEDQWFNQTLCRVNGCVVRLGLMQGEFHWHHHDYEDEFFFVVDGRFLIDLGGEGRTVELAPKQGFAAPRGVVHRTRAPERTVILMFEGAGVVPTGDWGGVATAVPKPPDPRTAIAHRDRPVDRGQPESRHASQMSRRGLLQLGVWFPIW